MIDFLKISHRDFLIELGKISHEQEYPLNSKDDLDFLTEHNYLTKKDFEIYMMAKENGFEAKMDIIKGIDPIKCHLTFKFKLMLTKTNIR